MLRAAGQESSCSNREAHVPRFSPGLHLTCCSLPFFPTLCFAVPLLPLAPLYALLIMYLKLGFFLGLKDLVASSHLPLLPTNCISISATSSLTHQLLWCCRSARWRVGCPALSCVCCEFIPQGDWIGRDFPIPFLSLAGLCSDVCCESDFWHHTEQDIPLDLPYVVLL